MAIARFLESYVFGPLGFWTMAPLRCAAKLDPFLSLDCAPAPSTLSQSKERKGSNFAIWQPCLRAESGAASSASAVVAERLFLAFLRGRKTLFKWAMNFWVARGQQAAAVALGSWEWDLCLLRSQECHFSRSFALVRTQSLSYTVALSLNCLSVTLFKFKCHIFR